MDLKTGQRLRSRVCDTEVIVIRLPANGIELTCGGREMVAMTEQAEGREPIVDGLDTGSQLGKRYTSGSDATLEILVTKAGRGTLADGATPLRLKDAKPLPSSD